MPLVLGLRLPQDLQRLQARQAARDLLRAALSGHCGLPVDEINLNDQPGQALATVGLGSHRGEMRSLGVSGGTFLFGQVRPRDVTPRPGFPELGEQLSFLLSDFLGLGLQRIGIRSGAGVGLGVQILGTLVGDADGGTDPLGQRGEPEPRLLGGVGPFRQGRHGGLVGSKLSGRLRQPGGGVVVFTTQRRLDVIGAGELGAPLHQVITSQPQPRIAQVCLDRLCPPGHLGLSAEGFELAAQFGGQIGEPRQVGRGRVELALRLLLALAVLEHTGGLFDEGPAILGPRLQNLGEPALPDDDVHLAADAGVAQQFLDVQQSAAGAVDLVLPRAVAEHATRDRHLGVLDRQRFVGVVDGQRDLGAAQRGPRGGAGEDDVLHLAAAQRLGALFAHDPGQGVDDVGLAGPVGPDDAGDTRFEAQSRRRSEGLEALQRQTLEVHVG